MELFRLFGSILIDDKDAINSLKKVDKKGDESGSKFGKLAKNGALIGAGVVGAAAAAGAAMGALAMKAADTADAIDENSQKLGVSRKTYQELGYIFRQNGGDVESFKGGMKKLTNTLSQAVGGNKAAVDAFKTLGVSIKDANGETRNQEDVMWDTMNALSGMKNQTDKAAMANKLFGKQGSELMPILNGGAKSIEEMRKQANDLGIVLSDSSVTAGAKFADTMQTLKDSGSAAFSQIGLELVPVLQKMANWVIKHMPQIKAIIHVAFKVIGDVVKAAAQIFTTYFLPVIKDIVAWVKKNWPTISKVVGTVMKVVGTIIGTAVKVIWTVFKGLGKVISFIAGIFGAIKNAITHPIQTAKDIISGIIKKIKDFFNFKVSLPKIKLPHFGIKPKGWQLGDLLKGKIPSLGIDWYAKGGVFNTPTIFPTANGYKGVGEAGPEAVAPISTLMDYIQTAVNSGETVTLLKAILEKTEHNIYIDKTKLVGATASDYSTAIGRLTYE